MVIILGVIVLLALVASIFIYGFKSGKQKSDFATLKKGVQDAHETTKRRESRRNDDIDDVRKRMRKFTRDE